MGCGVVERQLQMAKPTKNILNFDLLCDSFSDQLQIVPFQAIETKACDWKSHLTVKTQHENAHEIAS